MTKERDKAARSRVSKWAIDHGITYKQGLDILSDFNGIRKIWEFRGIHDFLTDEIERLKSCSNCKHIGGRCEMCYHLDQWEQDPKMKG